MHTKHSEVIDYHDRLQVIKESVEEKIIDHTPSPCKKKHYSFDRIGAIASAACAVHCFVTGVALSALSIFGLGFLGNESVDIIFVLVAIAFGSLAVFQGYKHHRSLVPSIMFFGGLAMVLSSHFLFGHNHAHHDHSSHGIDWLNTVLAAGGGLTIMCFHLVNAMLQKKALSHGHCCHRH